MSQNIFFFWGGAIFARVRSDQVRESVATEWGEAVGGGPPTVGSFFIFRLENVQSGAYLRRKFRLDDMYHVYYIIITCMKLKISHGFILFWPPSPPPPHQYASGSDLCIREYGVHNAIRNVVLIAIRFFVAVRDYVSLLRASTKVPRLRTA